MGVARVHEMHSNYLFHILIFFKIIIRNYAGRYSKACDHFNTSAVSESWQGVLILQSSYGKAFVLYSAV